MNNKNGNKDPLSEYKDVNKILVKSEKIELKIFLFLLLIKTQLKNILNESFKNKNKNKNNKISIYKKCLKTKRKKFQIINTLKRC